MTHLQINTMLLAQSSRLEHLSREFRGNRVRLDSEDLMVGLLVLAVLILLAWSATVAYGWFSQLRRRPGPKRLFLRLCRAHRLRIGEIVLLWKLARAQRLRDPARLFLEPERYEPAHLGNALRHQAERLASLRDRLFETEEPAYPEDGQDPDWDLPANDREGTPVAPVTEKPGLPIDAMPELPVSGLDGASV